MKNESKYPLFSPDDIYNELSLSSYGFLGSMFSKLLFKLAKGTRINKQYAQFKDLPPKEFVNALLKAWKVQYEIPESDLERIPKEGPFVMVCNHPTGFIDGLLMASLVLEYREDFKILTNHIIYDRTKAVQDIVLQINPNERHGLFDSRKSFLRALRHTRQAGCLGIFPAAGVSTYHKTPQGEKELTDDPWLIPAMKLMKVLEVPIIPMFIQSKNSSWYYRFARIHPFLRTLLLPSEAMRKRKDGYKIRIGKPILPKEFVEIGDIELFSDWVRLKAYGLSAYFDPKSKRLERIQEQIKKIKVKKAPKQIIAKQSEANIIDELHNLPREALLFETNLYSIYWASAKHIPIVLREIGRLREITFRDVGEGTNEDLDLDPFDWHYHHLILWSKDSSEIVGAYRMGMGADIFPVFGKNGFYLSTLFKFDDAIASMFQKSIELGRAFIIKEYQTKPLPLFLLWKGILHITLTHPEYEFIIGSVSISNQFSQFSKSLMVEFMRSHYFDSYLAQFVKPRKEFRVRFNEQYKDLFLNEAQEDLNKIDRIIEELEPGPLRMPVLLKKYIKQNARLIGFNVDKNFNDAIDGLMYIRIKDLPEASLKPVMEALQEKIKTAQQKRKENENC